MKGSTRWYDAEQLRRISEVTIAHYDRLAKAYWDGTRDHDVTQNYAARSLMRLRAIPPTPFLIWVVGPAENYATSDHWATTSWVWTDRPNSWPCHAPIRSARVSNRMSSRWNYRRGASMASLRMHRCSTCRARSCRGFGGTSRNLTVPGCAF